MQNQETLIRAVKRAFKKEPMVLGNVLKVHVDELTGREITHLHNISAFTEKVLLKRSGTGITVLITAWA